MVPALKNLLSYFHVLDKARRLKRVLLDEYADRHYSQEGEDVVLHRLFENRSTGFYVDVGAHHYKRFSNTYYFYKKGWRGINIDAMPGSMRYFNIFRRRDKNLEIPISNSVGEKKYYIFDDSALNGFSSNLSMQREKNTNYQIIDTIELQTFPLSDVLKRHLDPNVEVDFLSIDVEGKEYDVIISNDFEICHPKVIIVEMIGKRVDDLKKDKVTIFLKTKGYSVYAKTINSVFFLRNDFMKDRLGIAQ